MKTLREGAKAPAFKLQDKDGSTYGVGATKSDFTVLYFYPKDDTPGCTLEAQDFSKNLKDFQTRKAAVIGVSGGDRKTKQKFCEKYGLKVPLVSDADFSVCRAYGAYGEKKFMGRAYKGVFRKTFIVDSKGTIARIFDSVTPEGHAREVLKALDELRSGTKKPAAPKAATQAATKKAATKRPSSKKVTSKKAAVRKSTVKKTATKKPAWKKAVTAKSSKPSPRKTTARKASRR